MTMDVMTSRKIPRHPRAERVFESPLHLPLTQAQQPILLGHQMDPDSAAYNVANYIVVEGTLDHQVLLSALQRAVSETDSLRTRFFESGDAIESTPLQAIETDVVCELPILDMSGDADAVAAAHTWMEKDLATRIDLESGKLFSTSLLCVGESQFFWYFKTHHIALDGFALSMFFQRVAEAYSCLVDQREISPSPFGTVRTLIESEREYRDSDAFTQDRDYWRKKCTGSGEVVSFASEVALPSRKSLQHSDLIPKLDIQRLQNLADEASTHWVPVLIAAFAIFLSRTTNQQRVVLGIPFLNRLGTVAAKVPSTMANVLPLHIHIKPSESIGDIIGKVSDELSQMRLHQRYRAEDVRRDCNFLGENRRLTGPQININLFSNDLSFAGQRGSIHILNAGPADDLSLLIQTGVEEDGLRFIGMANPAVYRQDDLKRNTLRFLAFLSRFGEDVNMQVGRLDAFTEEELQFFFEESEATASASSLRAKETLQATLVSIFEQRVVETPEAIALTFNGKHVSYAALNACANRLAHEMLSANEIVGNPLVALLLPRSIETVVTIIASLKIGAGYVPIDPDAPAGRIESILADTKPVLLVTDASSSSKLETIPCPMLVIDAEETKKRVASQLPENPSLSSARRPSPDDLAYVIYTSGSTGKPKGVQITHHNVVRLFSSTHSWFDYRSSDVWTNCHSYIFDASVWEIWGALLHGGRLLIVPLEITRAPEQLLELVVAEKVTVFGQIPSAFYRFIEAEQDRPELGAQLSLRYQCFGGEALDLNRLKPWFNRHKEGNPTLLNMYGITETTINATYQFVTASQVASDSGSLIGKVYGDLGLMILDDALRPVPIGGYGEIYVTGEGLARGYLNRPDLNAVRFVADPFGLAGTRMYRSGDVAMLNENGAHEYMGRADQQVKVRGYRIELGEIESHLREHPTISDAIASVRSDAAGDPKLVAYVVPRADTTQPENIDVTALRDYLRERLPAYMVPSAIGILAALPFNQNGKVDRRALPEINVTSDRHVEPARDDVDASVLDVWCTHLHVDRLGIDDNFFDIGGDSIKAIRVCRELDIPVMDLFKDPTPRACANFLRLKDEAAAPKQETFLHHFGKQNEKGKLNLVCVPFAGGNALVFRQLVGSLSEAFSCSSVNLPGHDPTRPDEELMRIEDVAEQVVKEIMADVDGPIIVYGHCAGNAIAIAIARKLEKAGADLVTLVIGGMLPDGNPEDVLVNVSVQTGSDIIAFLRGLGGFKDVLDGDTLANISRMTKHDSMETATFFAVDSRNKQRLKAPIHVIVGDQDPLTAAYESRYLDWKSLSDDVSLSVIEGGGHYFVTDHAPRLAEVLEQQFAALTQSTKGPGLRIMREFHNPFDDSDGVFYLLANAKNQRSLWPSFVNKPEGWRVEFGPASRDACMQALQAQDNADFLTRQGDMS